jgi:hypothetical protein
MEIKTIEPSVMLRKLMDMKSEMDIAKTQATDAIEMAKRYRQRLVDSEDHSRALREENARLREALEPFAALELGPSGYCSFPLSGMVADARSAIGWLPILDSTMRKS